MDTTAGDDRVNETPRRDDGTAPEIALSAVWQAQGFTGPLCDDRGRRIEVVARGTWTHGFGPDFQDALITFDGRELRAGSVEIHLTTRGWFDHGHHRDPRYNDVVLHVVLDHDGAETRREDGAVVPVVHVGSLLTAPLDAANAMTADWSRFGGEVCAPNLVRTDPTIPRQILFRLGDARLAGRSARLEARLTAQPPAQVLYEEIWDGLGFHQNRESMRQLAAMLPLASFEQVLDATPTDHQLPTARGLLLGAAGFLPLSPTDAALAQLSPEAIDALEREWQRAGGPWRPDVLPATSWVRARVRPANHPARRLVAGAALVANSFARGGLIAAIFAPVHARAMAMAEHPGSAPDLAGHVRTLTESGDGPALGLDRSAAIVASGVLPFALALAEQTSDYALLDAAAAAWERLPGAGDNQVTRRALTQVAGTHRLGGLGSRGQQGLIHLDQTLCAPRRCFECPIARAVAATDAVTQTNASAAWP